MDLSFARFDRANDLHQLPGDLAVLMVGIAARQAASPTAAVQAGVVGDLPAAEPAQQLLAPKDGAFNGAMAAAIVRWGEP